MNEKVTVWEKIYDDLDIDLDDRSSFSFLIDASTFISFIKTGMNILISG